MKHTYLIILLVLVTFSTSIYSQGEIDIGMPANSPFQANGDISGAALNSINEVTGKVIYSAPLGAITSGPVGYNLSLSYDGQAGFRTGTEQNKYSPTSIVGVGWALPISRIVVDHKQTGTREDDEFYIVDGATTSKLILINKVYAHLWEFQLENYANWEITFDPLSDFWTIIKDDGITYTYGTNTSREFTSTWGNWIGDSNRTPTNSQGIVWNISKIQDQWGNRLDFAYESVLGRQNTSQSAHKHTEAIYLKEIISSRGARIKLNYGTKGIGEYYEPHREQSEPDAYQERYEKNYLQDVEIYNNSDQIVTIYNLEHTLYGSGPNQKRYLTNIVQYNYNNGQNAALPPQTFEYHISGNFEGGLKKITYPTGGSVTYEYENKTLFNNTSNRFVNSPSYNNYNSTYDYYSAYVSENYSLIVLKTKNPVSGDKYRFKFFRYWWNGEQWEEHEFTFPHLIADESTAGGQRLQKFQAVLEDDFYGFVYDEGTTADIYMFHRKKDGHSWDYSTRLNVNIGNEDPSFISGEDFMALGSHRNGALYTLVWNGSYWNYKQILQGGGQYYYAATNNFILSLDEDGGTDIITGAVHEDNYYMHYLDAEHRWQTKSWSAFADPRIHGIEKPSHFFPGNSLAGFVADDNPELFLRWNENYNLIAVDNVLGAYDDRNPLTPIASSLFTISNWFSQEPYKSARFNGFNWNVASLPSSSFYYAKLSFGEDLLTFQDHNSFNGVGYHKYDPNTNSFSYSTLNGTGLIANSKGNGITREFVIAGNKIYKRSRQGGPSIPFPQIGAIQYRNDFTYTDGLSHAFIREYGFNNGQEKSSYLYIDKETGLLEQISFPLRSPMGGRQKLGGYTPFMSTNSMWIRTGGLLVSNFTPFLHRIIDDKVNQSVSDIVVSSIELNDDNGNVRKINYTYNSPNTSEDNETTFYGEVIIENKGFGSGNIGKTKKIFNTGENDIQMLGLQLEEHILDSNNVLKAKTTNTWQKYTKPAHNGAFQVDLSHYVLLTNTREETFFDNNTSLESLTVYSYNTKGQQSSINTTNSKGQMELQSIRYAHEQYSFVRDKNMLADTYETTTKLDNETVNVERNIWVNSGGKVYPKERWSGPNISQLRLNSDASNVDNLGNILEINDGTNIYNSVLNGYSNVYEVATIINAKHQDVVNQLDVSYIQLQNLNTASLKTELMKLYNRLPNAMLSLTFYDDSGRVINRVNERMEESYIYYDVHGRVDYITDGYGKVIEKNEYHFGN